MEVSKLFSGTEAKNLSSYLLTFRMVFSFSNNIKCIDFMTVAEEVYSMNLMIMGLYIATVYQRHTCSLDEIFNPAPSPKKIKRN